jgi:hypothetical protein
VRATVSYRKVEHYQMKVRMSGEGGGREGGEGEGERVGERG